MTVRLPQNYIPLHYDLYIHYSKTIFLFDASATITFQKNQDSDRVTLMASKNLLIEKVIQNDIELKYELQYPKLVIFRSTEQDISEFPITIKYTLQPVFPDSHDGFFLYRKDNIPSFLTQFEPNFTSTLLPCFDEPCIRSSFRVKIRIPSDLVGLSNMPAETTTVIDDEKEITFLPTPPMCCYLLSIFVGPFYKSVKGISKNGTPIIIYSYDIDDEISEMYLRMAVHSVNWLEENMGAKYELPHLQFLSYEGIGVGMENYGLIALYDFNECDMIANSVVVMHEIAHLWFGDLVSIKWWDSIWLNEGFAQYFEYILLKDALDESADYAFELFLKYDGIRCLNYFDNEKIVCENFDFSEEAIRTVHYIKGAFVLKMFSDIIGEENFLKICSNYINKFKNKSVEISDFMEVVNETMKNNYSDFFDPWLNEIGFPLLNVEECKQQNEDGDKKINGIIISQKSFSGKIYKFKLPIIFEKSGEIKKMEVMIDKKETKIEVDFDWILVNDKVSSLCAVIYSKFLLEKLVSVKSKISERNAELIYFSSKCTKNCFPVDSEISNLCEEFSNEEPIYLSVSSEKENDENNNDDENEEEEEEENEDENDK